MTKISWDLPVAIYRHAYYLLKCLLGQGVHPIDKKTFAAQGNFVTSKSIKHTLTRVRHMRVPHSIFFVPIASLVPRKIKTPKMFLL